MVPSATMHRRAFLLLLLLSPLAHAAVPMLLQEAIAKLGKDTDRWAYTQTTIQKDDKGKPKSEVVMRFDPSKPYAEQYQVIKVDGKDPSDSQLRKYRRMGEKRGEHLEKAEATGTPPPAERKSLGELMDLDRATVLEENDKAVIYDVPLRKEGNSRFPPEKFTVTARVSKELKAFESVTAKLRAPIREKLILKLSAGEGQIDFKTVDPKYPPQLSEIKGTGSGSIFFVPVGRSYELRREDYKRVKPYGDRFDVQIGTLKALDF